MDLQSILDRFPGTYIVYGGKKEDIDMIKGKGTILYWFTTKVDTKSMPRQVHYNDILDHKYTESAIYVLFLRGDGIAGRKAEDAIDLIMSPHISNNTPTRMCIVVGAPNIVAGKYQKHTYGNICVIANPSTYFGQVSAVIDALGDTGLKNHIPIPFDNPSKYQYEYREQVYPYLHMYGNISNQSGIPMTNEMPMSIINKVMEEPVGSKRIPYVPGTISTALHYGQRKLLLAEIEFIADVIARREKDGTRRNSDNSIRQFVVVYAGAAPGTHIPYLYELFIDDVEVFHVWDRPTRFKINPDYKDTILITPDEYKDEVYSCLVKDKTIEDGFFTNEVARLYKGKDIVFISDIRDTPDEAAVERDMRMQESWVKEMIPYAAQLKFRFPYKDMDYPYLAGDIYTQAWGRQISTESRLVTYSHEGKMLEKVYPTLAYEETFAYFNKHTRMTSHNIGEVIRDSLKHITAGRYIDVPTDGLCTCHDCAREVQIICKYLSQYQPNATIDTITKMIHDITIQCSSDSTLLRTLWEYVVMGIDPTDRSNVIYSNKVYDRDALDLQWKQTISKYNISNKDIALPLRSKEYPITTLQTKIKSCANIIFNSDDMSMDEICELLATKEPGKVLIKSNKTPKELIIDTLKGIKVPFIIDFHRDLVPMDKWSLDKGPTGGKAGSREYIKYLNEVAIATNVGTITDPISILFLYCLSFMSKTKRVTKPVTIKAYPSVQSGKQFDFIIKHYKDKLQALLTEQARSKESVIVPSLMKVITSNVSGGVSDCDIYDKLYKMYHRLVPQAKPLLSEQRSTRRANDIVNLLPKEFTPSSYLDIGCSEGSITADLATVLGVPNVAVYGCDVKDVYTTDFTFTRLEPTTTTLPYGDSSMDLITVLMVLHHIPHSDTTIKEMYRILRPGGYLVIREHDINDYRLNVLIDIMHGFYSLVWYQVKESPAFCTTYYAKYRSLDEWESSMHDVGFTTYNKPPIPTPTPNWPNVTRNRFIVMMKPK